MCVDVSDIPAGPSMMIGRLPHASARARRRKLVAVDAQMMSGDDADEGAEEDDEDMGVEEG